MSTGKTANLGLNQWQLTDPFLMEELNQDNRNIDAAVQAAKSKAEACPMVKLFDVTVQAANVANIELDLKTLDLSKFINLKLCYVTTTNNQAYVRLNKVATDYQQYLNGWQVGGAYMQLATGYYDIELCGEHVICHNWASARRSYATPINAGNLKTIDLMFNSTGTSNFPVGTRFVLTGVKA